VMTIPAIIQTVSTGQMLHTRGHDIADINFIILRKAADKVNLGTAIKVSSQCLERL